MIKTLTKHGNSYALVIDKPILDLLRIDPTSPLEISTDGHVLTITPAATSGRRKGFKAALDRVNRTHAAALKKLAE